MNDRLDAQIAFLVEADQLKSVTRSNVLLDRSRPENSAEHSWHVAPWAMVFANDMPAGADLGRALSMLLLHDVVEIDAGDHPVDQNHHQAEIEAKEQKAADRLFALLPEGQAQEIRALWEEFETNQTPSAVFAKRIDHIQPIFQVLCAPERQPGHEDIARHTLFEGRAKRMKSDWPTLYRRASELFDTPFSISSDLDRCLSFLAEADRLKSVQRASLLCNRSRFENSAEHSWHVALYALILADQAPTVDIYKTIQMLLLHDLVEIDAGDAPVFGDHDASAIEAAEQAAADRIFGLLPDQLNHSFRAIWDEFEANQSPEAQFAKSLDRFVPPIQNLNSGGGSWVDYDVTWEMFETRVGQKIANGAPGLWAWVAPRVRAFLDGIKANA
ncbi:5'-nucleotidase [Pelagimonas phthalicica]|uniref:5'-deoxynucleotidase n=1 Tax=Pelagimonas phthalicica TaxID=1037362 RepID=A0A238JDR6_9RHOB|nr:HD domain-containing protein [Pelagimonas phthalicica]TDS91783.1 putative hydrolase of HD superfamily [Pelagimonas phthalicica]SMX28831.1 5'-nucleotidase [Pelagimonas phthalicica]